MMQRFRAPIARFSIVLPPSPATRLMWLIGCALLLFATNAYAGQVSLVWDAVSAPNLSGYRLYYGQTSHTYTSHIDVGIQTTATVTGLTAGQSYVFAVTALDSMGKESLPSNEVSATITATTSPPVVAFSASSTSGPAPATVTFTNASTGTIMAWAWNFGDGTSSTLQSPSHTYSAAGTYNVKLTVTGPGGSNTVTKTGYITVAPALLEVGDLTVDSNWKRITLRQTCIDPTVVATPLSANDFTPVTIRLRNVGPTGFDIRIQEYDYLDGIHGSETVSYLVMERGPHTLGTGIRVEAGRLSTNEVRTTPFASVTFSQAFGVAPVVVASVTSVNDAPAVTTRMQNVTPTGFQVALQEQINSDQYHGTESIDYVAWMPSSGTVDGLTFDVHTTPNAVTDNVYTVTFTAHFLAVPMFLAGMQTTNEWEPVVLRLDAKDPVEAHIQLEEEASATWHDLHHAAEIIGYMAFTYQ